MNNKIALIVPTIRKESILRFLKEWSDELEKYNVTLFVIEDYYEPTIDFSDFNYKVKIYHFSWKDFREELGENEWIIPRHNASIRSFGFYMAYKMGFEIIITLDDDCYPLNKYYTSVENYDFFKTHLQRLLLENAEITEEAWEPTVLKIRSRGFPYYNFLRNTTKKVKVILNHGLWANIPDLDAINQFLNQSYDLKLYFIDKLIPKNKYFSMCGMNIAFKREATPALYFLLMGEDEKGNKYPYDRFDDIWAGIFFKKIADHLNYDVLSGHPVIWHDRASNFFKNLQKEANGIEINERLWQIVDDIKLTKDNFKDCYKELAYKLPLNDEYFTKLKKSMIIWSDLF